MLKKSVLVEIGLALLLLLYTFVYFWALRPWAVLPNLLLLCARPLLIGALCVLTIWNVYFYARKKNGIPLAVRTLHILILVTVIYLGAFHFNEIAFLRDIINFQAHREAFESLVSYAVDIQCPSWHSDCLSLSLPTEAQAWTGQESIFVARDRDERVRVLALVGYAGLHVTYIADQNQIPEPAYAAHYWVNCLHKLDANWFICRISSD